MSFSFADSVFLLLRFSPLMPQLTVILMQRARIRLSSPDMDALQDVIDEITRVVSKTGVKLYGPVPLPTKRLTIPTQKSPCGEGTTTWEHYQLRIHKRLIDINADERSMIMIMKIMFPESVLVEIELI